MTRSLAEEAADPKTTPQRMRELIQTDRSLYATVACNPNIDEPLRQWLWVNGGRDVQEAMVQQYEEAVRAQQEGREAKGDSDAKKLTQPDTRKKPTSTDQGEVERLIAEHEQSGQEAKAKRQEELDRLEAERQETERLAKERAEAERLAHEEAARLKAARAEAERLAAVRADEERRLAEQRKAAAELASIQAEAQAFAAQDSASASAEEADDAESTVVVNRSSRPFTRVVTNAGQIFNITSDVVILGRKPRGFLGESVQVLNIKDTERTISKTHARLSWHDDAWYICDLGSTNGVSVGAGNSLVELSGNEEMKVEGPFSLGLHDMRLEVQQ